MSGFVFYEGPSELDGSPIVAIATLESENSKTGDMIQTWILRKDVHPLEAIGTGADASICGDCVHRGVDGPRTCYVDVGKAPAGVWKAYHRGAYLPLMGDPGTIASLVRGRVVRLGSYGDPAAVPVMYWHALVYGSDGHSGYSHQWRRAEFQDLRAYCMASVESESERDLAHAMGWRTFRVRSESQSLAQGEIVCPASDEGGKRRQCIQCRACDGADRPGKASIAIVVHGRAARHFQPV